jgi:hypothetical protein
MILKSAIQGTKLMRLHNSLQNGNGGPEYKIQNLLECIAA